MANTADNPFAPPTADVADVYAPGETQAVSLWSARGRIGRLRHVAWSMAGYLVVAVVGVVAGMLTAMNGSPSLWLALTVAGYLVYLVFLALLTIQRCHDMDWNGWAWLLVLIPLVGLIFWLLPGTQGSNRYGAPPPPNPRGMGWLAAIPLLLFVLGIVAAIALPAYQGYAKRAAAMQGR